MKLITVTKIGSWELEVDDLGSLHLCNGNYIDYPMIHKYRNSEGRVYRMKMVYEYPENVPADIKEQLQANIFLLDAHIEKQYAQLRMEKILTSIRHTRQDIMKSLDENLDPIDEKITGFYDDRLQRLKRELERCRITIGGKQSKLDRIMLNSYA